MRVRFDEQLEQLNVMLIEMGALCEEAITYAVKALNENSSKMREKTHETENLINEKEQDIESLCLKLLLQQQPVAKDLRVISSALKMISDMERIGDQAYDISEISKTITAEEREVCEDHINEMTAVSIEMVKTSIDSFVRKDTSLANSVILKDDRVDELFREVRNDLLNAVAEDKAWGEHFIDSLMIAKYLERISDHAVNIAEWVIFSITGEHINETNVK